MPQIALIVWRAAAAALGCATAIAVFNIFATPRLALEDRATLVLYLGLAFAASAAGYGTYRVGYFNRSVCKKRKGDFAASAADRAKAVELDPRFGEPPK
jgi:hypothetical protein